MGSPRRSTGKEGEPKVKLTHACILTEEVEALTSFYRDVLAIEPRIFSPDYVEFPTGGATLSIYRLSAHLRLAPGSGEARSNRSLELEFLVENVDEEYSRLRAMPIEWVKPPTTQPWGNRSFYFRDPDGNLVNFYGRVAVP